MSDELRELLKKYEKEGKLADLLAKAAEVQKESTVRKEQELTSILSSLEQGVKIAEDVRMQAEANKYKMIAAARGKIRELGFEPSKVKYPESITSMIREFERRSGGVKIENEVKLEDAPETPELKKIKISDLVRFLRSKGGATEAETVTGMSINRNTAFNRLQAAYELGIVTGGGRGDKFVVIRDPTAEEDEIGTLSGARSYLRRKQEQKQTNGSQAFQ